MYKTSYSIKWYWFPVVPYICIYMLGWLHYWYEWVYSMMNTILYCKLIILKYIFPGIIKVINKLFS